MTSVVSSRSCRGASLALGGMFIAASSLLIGAPTVTAAPSTEAVDAIDSRYADFGGETSLLGAPLGDAVDVPGGAVRDYAGGAIYYSKDTGAHVMYGAILDRYKDLGGPVGSKLGFPKNDESDTGDGTGRFNDFSDPAGASMYWTPQWGASVIRGRVLEAWRQSGAITGPFGYPSTDTSIADGVQTGKFVGPEGTEIQWSPAAGLVTIPAALAATIPGFGTTTPTADGAPTAEGTTSVTKPGMSGSAATDAPKKSSKWWWIPVGVAVLALLGGLVRLLTRKPAAPVKVAAQRAPEQVRKVVAPPPPAPPVTKLPPPVRPVVKAPAPSPAPQPPAPPTPPTPPAPAAPPAPAKAPAKVVPLVKTPPPPAPPMPPPPPPAPRPVVEVPKIEAPKIEAPKIVPDELAEPPKATIRTTQAEPDVSPVIKYASHEPAETTIQVTYENNALGDNQESVADKSDSVPDSQQL